MKYEFAPKTQIEISELDEQIKRDPTMVAKNEAEYEALLQGMTMVQKMGGKAVEVFSNSRLVVGQVKGELEARDVRMQEYLNQVRHFRNFADFRIGHALFST